MNAINATKVKYTQGHDRLTITVKFPNGENLRVNSSRSRSPLSCKRPTGLPALKQYEMQAILTKAEPIKGSGETFGAAMERLARSLEAAISISHAATVV